MGRPRRYILSRGIYEICMRTKRGLPFVCTEYMKLLLKSVMARVQRDEKVELCHFVWMRNHVHIIIRARDSAQCTRFYGEIKKQLTDAIKRLLGKSHLSLWTKNGTSVIQYGDLEGVVERIAYLYANPARAGLVDTIEQYPGLSSFDAFTNAKTLSSQSVKSCTWVRTPAIPRLPRPALSALQDRHFTAKLRASSKKKHELIITPNSWMQSFGVSADEEVQEVNQQIQNRLLEFEEEAREKRAAKGWKAKGANKLRLEAISLRHIPKPDSIRIFVYAIDRTIRTEMIAAYKEFCNLCAECYELWKKGHIVEWPPGAFLPALPPRQNVFA